MEYLLTVIVSWALAGIFFAAAVHKTRNYLEFVGILNQYKILPAFSIQLVAPLVVATEFVCAVTLISGFARGMGLAIAAGLLATYIVAIAINIARGRTAIDCGCGGEATPLTGWLVLRNLILLVLAGAGWSVSEAAMPPVAYLVAAATTAMLWLSYSTTNQLLSNWGKQHIPADQHG